MFDYAKVIYPALFAVFVCMAAPKCCMAHDVSLDYSYWDTDDGKAASGIMLHGAADVGLPAFKLEGRISYYEDISLTEDPRISVMPVELGGRLHLFPGSMIDPYGSLGLGYYMFDGSSGFSIDDEWGGYAVIGSHFLMADVLGGFALNAEFFYRYIQDASRGSFGDYDASGWGLNVGAGFRW